MFHNLTPELREGPFKIPEDYFETLPGEVSKRIAIQRKMTDRLDYFTGKAWVGGGVTFVSLILLSTWFFLPQTPQSEEIFIPHDPVVEDTYTVILLNNYQDETFSTILEKEYLYVQEQSGTPVACFNDLAEDTVSISREDIVTYLSEQKVTYAEIINIY